MRIAILVVVVACSSPKTQTVTPPKTSDCPAAVPADRSSCPRYLVKCNYWNEARCPFAYCADVASQLVWMTSYDHCPVACPPARPAVGSACAPVSTRTCDYKGGDKCGFRLRCTASGWAQKEITLCGGM